MVNFLQKNNTFSNKAIISTDSDSRYYFFLPIVALMWTKMEFQANIYLVGEEKYWLTGYRRFIIDETLKNGGNVHLIDTGCKKRKTILKGYGDGVIAQVSRFLPFQMHGIKSTDYCLTSDIDMLPLEKKWFHQGKGKKPDIFYANSYNHTRYTVCYIGMTRDIWQQLISVKGEDIYQKLNKMMSGLPRHSPVGRQWGYDETWLYKKIISFPQYPNSFNMINRTIHKNPSFKPRMPRTPQFLPQGRLDRSNWYFNGNTKGLIDAHCKRPGFLPQNWLEIKDLIKNFVTREELKNLQNYYNNFVDCHSYYASS
jgi:hypothetical protein